MKKEYMKPEQHTVVLHCRQQLLTVSTFGFTDVFSSNDGFVDPDTEIDVEDAL